jgi:hypothetical protein
LILAWVFAGGCAQGEDIGELEAGTPAGSAGADGGAKGGAAGAGGGAKGGAAGAGGAAAGSGGAAAGGGGAGGTGGEPPNCHLVVNEVLTARAGIADDEFVELFNPCSSTVQLPGWRLVYRSSSGTSDVTLFKFTAGTIKPGEYWVIAGTAYSGGASQGTFSSGALSAQGGGVGLHDGTAMVDSMGYGTATNALVEGTAPPSPPEDSSLGRSPNGQDTDDNAWDFKQFETPSPGAANPG